VTQASAVSPPPVTSAARRVVSQWKGQVPTHNIITCHLQKNDLTAPSAAHQHIQMSVAQSAAVCHSISDVCFY